MQQLAPENISYDDMHAIAKSQLARFKDTRTRGQIATLGLLAMFAMYLATMTSAAATPAKLPAGMFSTTVNQIVDQNHDPVRLSCVYWPGLNHQDGPLAGLKGPIHGIPANVEAIAAAGFQLHPHRLQ